MRPAALLLACLVACSLSAGEAGKPDRAKEALAFAESLFDEGDYYRAITEYKRAAFLAPGTELEQQARFGIGRAYQAGEKWEEAAEAFGALARTGGPFAERSACELAETLRLSGYEEEACQAYRDFLKTFPKSSLADRARKGLAACLARLGRLKEAAEALEKVPDADQARKGLEAPPGLKPKSPVLAGGMSALLPGSGQWYAGRPAGASYFLLNAALIAASAESFHTNRDVLGSILAAGALLAYAGNIYGAVGDAHKANREAEDRALKGIEDSLRLGRPGPEVGASASPGFALVWSVKF